MCNRDELVSIIRGVHENLKRDYQRTSGDYNTVWLNHLHDTEKREQYSKAMFQLATTAWQEKNTRITWCHQICMEYFYEGKLEKLLRKKKLIADYEYISDMKDENKTILLPLHNKIQLLDVGSCYNPFSIYSEYQCLAIDLTPAIKDVLKCDFLQLRTVCSDNKKLSTSTNSGIIKELPESCFDVIVFSLVLEYLPAPEQRWTFCCKAWNLLKYNGLLLVVTPDSKRQHCNAPMMRKWRTAFQNIGFERIAYEKQRHLHCMAFQKMCHQPNPLPAKENVQLLHIPQDFHQYVHENLEEQKNRTEEEDRYIQLCFTELPILV